MSQSNLTLFVRCTIKHDEMLVRAMQVAEERGSDDRHAIWCANAAASMHDAAFKYASKVCRQPDVQLPTLVTIEDPLSYWMVTADADGWPHCTYVGDQMITLASVNSAA